MFSAFGPRSTSAYQQIKIETATHTIDPHQIVSLLFDGLLASIVSARGALARGDVPGKCAAVAKAVRIMEEGLMTGLDTTDGGPLAGNLQSLYDYALRRLIWANARNDDAIFLEVQSLIEPVAQGWKAIRVPMVASPVPSEAASPRLALAGA